MQNSSYGCSHSVKQHLTRHLVLKSVGCFLEKKSYESVIRKKINANNLSYESGCRQFGTSLYPWKAAALQRSCSLTGGWLYKPAQGCAAALPNGMPLPGDRCWIISHLVKREPSASVSALFLVVMLASPLQWRGCRITDSVAERDWWLGRLCIWSSLIFNLEILFVSMWNYYSFH